MLFRPNRREQPVEIWECRPLVVFHGIDGVVYAANTDAEFDRGKLRALTPTPFGWHPEITVDAENEPPSRMTLPGYQPTPGRTLFGHDEHGDSFTWLIGRDAVEFLLTQPEGSLGEVDDPSILPEE